MTQDDSIFDLIVIGSGPAGQKGAIAASKMGKRVAIVEKRLSQVGGVSLHQGTIPSKTIREAILHLTGYRQRHVFELAYAAKRKITIDELRKKLLQVVGNELKIIRDQLDRNGIHVFEGKGVFRDEFSIDVINEGHSRVLSADHFLIAAGSKPLRPDFVPFDGKRIFDSNQILELKRIPSSMIVIGGGVVGIEYALMFAILGVKVTIVDQRSTLLNFCDREVIDCLMFTARALGIEFRLEESVARIAPNSSRGVTVELESNKQISAETALFSGGRQSDVEDLALENAGVRTGTNGKVVCDEFFKTNSKNIYAVGDVIGHPALSSTSMEQGRRAVLSIYNQSVPMPTHLPYGLYTIPEIAMIGFTEKELTSQRIPYETGKSNFSEICRGQISGNEVGFLKILFHAEKRTILGVHCIGESATELVHVGQAVMHFGGTIDYFVDSVFNYPTMAECYKNAALDGINKVRSRRSIPVSPIEDCTPVNLMGNIL